MGRLFLENVDIDKHLLWKAMTLNIYPSPAWRHLSSKGRLEEYLMSSGIDPHLKIDPQLPEATA